MRRKQHYRISAFVYSYSWYLTYPFLPDLSEHNKWLVWFLTNMVLSAYRIYPLPLSISPNKPGRVKNHMFPSLSCVTIPMCLADHLIDQHENDFFFRVECFNAVSFPIYHPRISMVNRIGTGYYITDVSYGCIIRINDVHSA